MQAQNPRTENRGQRTENRKEPQMNAEGRRSGRKEIEFSQKNA
jgi:hypothetical protein